MKHMIPTSLRRWEERAAARRMADALLRADARRHRASAMPRLDKKKVPPPTTEPRRLHLSDLKRALAAKRCLHVPTDDVAESRVNTRAR